MLKNLFYKSLFMIQYIPENKIMAIILANIYANKYNFFNKEFAKKGISSFWNLITILDKM